MLVAARHLNPPPYLSITPEYLSYNKGSLYLAIVATLVSIALSIFLLRAYTRIKLLHFFGIDDILMLVAVSCAVAVLSIFIALTRLGIGKHLWAVHYEDLLKIAHRQWFLTLFIILGIGFVKLSVAFFLLRIIHRANYRRFLYVMIALLTPLTFAWAGTFIFQCIPVSAAWDPNVSQSRCMSHVVYRNVGLAHSAINAMTDLVIAILLIPMVWTLRISLRTRVSLMVVLSLGFLASAAAVIRMPLIYNLWDSTDPFTHDAWLIVWSVTEMTLGTTAACLPCLEPLLDILLTALSKLTPLRRASPRHSTHATTHAQQNHTPHHVLHSSITSTTNTIPLLTRPKNPYLRRFHDHESCLDFDLETPPPYSTRGHTRSSSIATAITDNNNNPLTPPLDNITENPHTNAKPMSGKGSRGLSDIEDGIRDWTSGYAVSITSGETPWENGRGKDDGSCTNGRVAGDEESAFRFRLGGSGSGGEGIVRTTTTEVKIT